MIKQNFIEGFNRSITTKKINDGIRVLNNDLVENIDYSFNNLRNEIYISTNVISEDLYSKYNCNININLSLHEVISTKCTCKDFENNELNSNNYACKHLCASFYRFLEKLEDDSILKYNLKKNILSDLNKLLDNRKSNTILDLLCNNKKLLKIDVYINRNPWSHKIGAEFKIGLKNSRNSKMYLLKDINMFLLNKYNSIPISYGKDFTFDITKQKFSYNDIRLFKFIEMLKEIDINSNNFKRNQDRYINGKEIWIPKGMLRLFFEIIRDNRIYLNNGFYSRKIESEIITDDIPLPIELKEKNNNISFKLPRGLPEDLGGSGDVFLYDTVIYIPSMRQCEKLYALINTFVNIDEITFLEKQKDRVYKELIPNINELSNTVIIDKNISKNIISTPVKFKFYFDRNEMIFLKVNVVYGDYEFNIFNEIKGKYIYRDIINESKVINTLKDIGIEKIDSRLFAFLRDDEVIFDFFKNKIYILQELGEVFYSENFKGILRLSKNNFDVEVCKGKHDYFEFKYSVSNISKEEFYNIMKSFKENKKYYKLKNGDFLDLEDIQVKEFLRLIDILNDKKISDNSNAFSKGKSLYVNKKLTNLFESFKGDSILNDISNKLSSDNLSKVTIPKGLNASLRDYQLYGLKWFNELSNLGFGGILGDEMGLGKTIQTISFILSKENSKSIIIAPTSLIYNWRDEFSKFAPSIKLGLVNDTKKKRVEILNDINKYDVIITTYNLFRIDYDLYKNIKFDLCFLDEAQYIKNFSAKNTKACKKINANNRFALTGTPIENNLMELWSIFDFIMPGFLYDKDSFNSKFNRSLDEDEVILDELRLLISPFILRRRKKDVLYELPDKIEKIIKVDMDKEQKKVYASYTKYITDIIDNKIKNDELNTSKIEILSYITKLRQICLDPSLVMEDYKGNSGKLVALRELLIDMSSNGHKILVFSQFTSVLIRIKDILQDNNLSYYYLDGSTKSSTRQELVNKFNKDNTNVFLISLKAGGTGLNLTSADVVIHFDPWWNPAVEEQATDRAHRIGQKNIVEVIKLVSEGTIEEKIINLQDRKRKLIENLVGKDSLDNKLFSNLSNENILKLFEREH